MFLEMVKTVLESVWAIFGAIVNALFQMFPIYETVSEFQNQILACVLGVPVAIVIVAKFLFRIFRHN